MLEPFVVVVVQVVFIGASCNASQTGSAINRGQQASIGRQVLSLSLLALGTGQLWPKPNYND